MDNFGKLKDKILKKLTESYYNDDKSEIKKILKLIKSDKNFKEMFLFYEGVENLELSYPGSAQLYVESIEKILIEKQDLVRETCKKLKQYISDVNVDENPLYESIDILSENSKLTNLDKKVIAKKTLIDHLTKKKEKLVNETKIHNKNENLLMAVLTNNFNIIYENTLDEFEKIELKNILSLNDSELNIKTTELRESILSNVKTLLTETTDTDLKEKLNSVEELVSTMEISKINYYRMTQLKNGLN